MSKKDTYYHDDQIEIKKFFFMLYSNRYFILSITVFLGILSYIYAYQKMDIYSATASVKVGVEQSRAQDVVSMAMGKSSINADTEKDIILSGYLTQKALEYVDFRHHYYKKGIFKEKEVYKDAPFQIDMVRGFGISFQLHPVDESRFRLRVEEARGEKGEIWSYDHIHSYNHEINTTHFHLRVAKVNNFREGEYRFVIDFKNHRFGSVYVMQNRENTTILKIVCEDTVALRAKEFANALAKAYILQNVEEKTVEAGQRLSFIEKQLESSGSEIKKAADNLEEFRSDTDSLSDIGSRKELIANRLAEYELRLYEMLLRESLLNNLMKKLDKNSALDTLSTEGIVQPGSPLEVLINQLKEAVLEKDLLRLGYTQEHPTVIKIERKISRYKKNISNTVVGIYDNLKQQKRITQNFIKEQRELLKLLPKNEQVETQLQRKLEVAEDMQIFLQEKRTEAQMVMASTVSKNRILDHARLPLWPVKPQRDRIVLFGVIIGFLLGILWIILRDYLNNKIHTKEDIINILDRPVIGTIPHIADLKVDKNNVQSIKSLGMEAFRTLRSNLQFLKKEDSQLVLLTSTVSSEGKTTVSINLAYSLSLLNQKTIVLSVDMRKPTLDKRLNLPHKVGLSEYLIGKASLDKVIQKSQYEHLDVIGSGSIPPNPNELIQSDKMNLLLIELKKRYDTIILDAPPIGLVSDAKELIYKADVTLYVVRANYSKKEYLETIEHIEIHGAIANLMIVLNDTNTKQGYYDYKSYGYYGKYNTKEN